jgi:hypothetical protein
VKIGIYQEAPTEPELTQPNCLLETGGSYGARIPDIIKEYQWICGMDKNVVDPGSIGATCL